MEDVNEDRYEGINLVIRSRQDGQSWFDVIENLISETCEGDASLDKPCTCGLEVMSGGGGTYDQVMDWRTTVGYGLQPIDLAKGIMDLTEGYIGLIEDISEETLKVIEWAKKEIALEAYYENEEWRNYEEEEEEE